MPIAKVTHLENYRHHKGGTYTLMFVALDSRDKTTELAIYVSHSTDRIWSRPLAEFNEPIRWSDGVTRARFTPEREDAVWNVFPGFFDEIQKRESPQ